MEGSVQHIKIQFRSYPHNNCKGLAITSHKSLLTSEIQNSLV